MLHRIAFQARLQERSRLIGQDKLGEISNHNAVFKTLMLNINWIQVRPMLFHVVSGGTGGCWDDEFRELHRRCATQRLMSYHIGCFKDVHRESQSSKP